MSWQHTRDAGALVSRCQQCGHVIRARMERDVEREQRAHSWQSCQQRRTETARAAEAERATAIPDEFCGKGHLRTAWNTRVDKAGDKRCSDCRRERREAAKNNCAEACVSLPKNPVSGVSRETIRNEAAPGVNPIRPLTRSSDLAERG